MDSLVTRLNSLKETLEGDLKYDIITKTIYATDASDYREQPVAVAWPTGVSDLKKILQVCLRRENRSYDQGCRHITCRSGCGFRNYCRYLPVYEQESWN